MEQETKYSIKDRETADLIWAETLEGKFAKVLSSEEVEMNAAYYDTKDRILMKHQAALRTRCEGETCFATLKWGADETVDGLHSHEEINIPFDTDTCPCIPPKGLFDESEDAKKLMSLLGDKELETLFTNEVKRRRAKLDYEGSIMELAIDQGTITAGDKTAPISEIEIELYSGKLDKVIKLTNEIAAQFLLKPENKSKYARAMELVLQNLLLSKKLS